VLIELQACTHWVASARPRSGRSIVSETPWSSFCTEEGGNRLVAARNHYYWQRYADQFSYGDVYGEAGRRYVVKVWTTADDNRIERETYGRGYLRLDALQSPMHKAVADLVRDERVTGKPCA
jgi:hypothetical protein